LKYASGNIITKNINDSDEVWKVRLSYFSSQTNRYRM